MWLDKGDGQVYHIHQSGMAMDQMFAHRLLLVPCCIKSNAVVVAEAEVAARVLVLVAVVVATVGSVAASITTLPALEGGPSPISFDLLAVEA